MSRREIVLLVSRALALPFISSAISEATLLPERIFSLSHYWKQGSVLVEGLNFTSKYYLILIGFLVLRMIAYVVVSVLLWKCGPRVEGLFSHPQVSEAAAG